MDLRVDRTNDGHQLVGDWAGAAVVNAFLRHLAGRNFSPATIRAYAYDLLGFARFLTGRGLSLAQVVAVDIFDWIDAQQVRGVGAREKVVALRSAGAAPASVNRRVAAVRALYEYQVMIGALAESPVPLPRRATGMRPARGPAGASGFRAEARRWSLGPPASPAAGVVTDGRGSGLSDGPEHPS